MKIFRRLRQRRQYKVSVRNFLKLQEDLKRSVKILLDIDEELKKHHPRSYRRRFWYDFYRNRKVRTEIFKQLLKKYEVNVEAIKQQQARMKRKRKPKAEVTRPIKASRGEKPDTPKPALPKRNYYLGGLKNFLSRKK